MNKDEIYELVIKLRHAIDRAADNREFNGIICFDHFPRGCCGMASDILGHYLLEYGIESEYVCGDYSKGDWDNCQSHAWVRLDDKTIIDITGDQFKSKEEFLFYNEPVYMGPMDEFHSLFEEDFSRRSARIDEFSGVGTDSLLEIYSILAKYL